MLLSYWFILWEQKSVKSNTNKNKLSGKLKLSASIAHYTLLLLPGLSQAETWLKLKRQNMSTKQGGALQQSHSSRQKVLSSFSSTATADKVQAVAAEANYSAQFSFKNYYFQVKNNKLELVNFFPLLWSWINECITIISSCLCYERDRAKRQSICNYKPVHHNSMQRRRMLNSTVLWCRNIDRYVSTALHFLVDKWTIPTPLLAGRILLAVVLTSEALDLRKHYFTLYGELQWSNRKPNGRWFFLFVCFQMH